jgi:hypothetical protein
MRPRLVLKKIDVKNEKTERLYSLVSETVQSFNVYVADFYESVAILEEQYDAAVKAGNTASAREADEKISYMKERIEQLNASMKSISEEMHSLVELHLSA